MTPAELAARVLTLAVLSSREQRGLPRPATPPHRHRPHPAHRGGRSHRRHRRRARHQQLPLLRRLPGKRGVHRSQRVRRSSAPSCCHCPSGEKARHSRCHVWLVEEVDHKRHLRLRHAGKGASAGLLWRVPRRHQHASYSSACCAVLHGGCADYPYLMDARARHGSPRPATTARNAGISTTSRSSVWVATRGVSSPGWAATPFSRWSVSSRSSAPTSSNSRVWTRRVPISWSFA